MAEWNSEANDVFLAAAEVESPDERRRLLDERCGNDAALRAQVESLLAASAKAGSFLNRPAVQVPLGSQATAAHEPLAERPGTVVGPYRLMEQIGEGGMGLVFVAEQQHPVRRKVALKVVKPGMDTREVIARFEAERQALALMDHPNIAKVLDAGTTDSGRPYFVMELVKGVPITDYCDQNQLTPRERLGLFVSVCQAVQHAHTKGVIHRDLKPSNVLVTLHDGTPVVKVIDFGVAKAVGQHLTEKTVYTAFAQMIGTPLYMSPEQAEMSGLDIDTRSDVYSLSVLLYELLTGTTPVDGERLKRAAFEEIRRIIREEEPPRPSTRLSTLGATLSAVSARRKTEPGKLPALLRGDLDWIVMKGLEKDRTRRYETASALAADVRRHLAEEPVEARPPSAGYRLRKFVRRNRVGVFVTSFAAAGVFALLFNHLIGLHAVRVQRDRAVAAEQDAEAARLAAVRSEKQAEAERDAALALNEKYLATLYAAHVNLAQQAWEAGSTERVRDLLQQHRPKKGDRDPRGFEWHYLNNLCHTDLLTLKHGGMVRSVAYSPDGKRLASASADKTVKVWDAQSGEEVFTLNGGPFVSVAFSPDGKLLATASEGRMTRGEPPQQRQRIPGEVKVWDAKTGKELLTIEGSDGGGQVVFSPDSKHVARGIYQRAGVGEVKLWDAQTGKETHSLNKRRGNPIHSLAFSLDGSRLALGVSGGRGGLAGLEAAGVGEVKVLDVQTGAELLSLKGRAASLAFSPDGKRLAVRDGDAHAVRVWDAASGQELLSLKGDYYSVAYSPDGKRLAGTSNNGKTVTVWDSETGKELRTFRGHDAEVEGMVFSPDGARVASASWDGTVKVWDAHTRQDALQLPGETGVAAFSPDGTRLAYESEEETVLVLDTRTRKEVFALKGHTVPIESIAYSPDGKLLASVGGGLRQGLPVRGEIKVWDAGTGRELFALKELAVGLRGAAFSPDGKRLASAGEGLGGGPLGPGFSVVTVWDAWTGRELLALKDLPPALRHVAFSPDGKRLVGGTQGTFANGQRVSDAEAKVWDAETGEELFTLKGCSRVVYSPDGTLLAGGSGTEVKVWDAESGRELHTLRGHSNTVVDVSFSPDGTRLASAAGDKTARLWDARTGEELCTLKGHTAWLSGVAFSPDTRRVVTSSEDRTAKVWDTRTGHELLTLKHDGEVGSAVFSPDGHLLAGITWEGTVTIWDATPRAEPRPGSEK